jgi:WhiB family redox-sensing transcriptional regulator
MSDTSWFSNAACRGSDTNFFFPEVGVSMHHTAAIREICSKCPVKTECLELGLESQNDEYGFFGGKSPRERQAINANRKRAARAALLEARRVHDDEPKKALDMDCQAKARMA